MALQERTAPVTLVAPAGLYERVDTAADLGNLPFAVESVPLEAGVSADPVYATEGFTVRAAPLDHRAPTHGYRFQERTRRGRFYPDEARALGVTDPGDFGRLTRGEPVTTDAGRTVHPSDVLGPERPDIGVAYVTDTQPCDGGRDLATGADVLYHDATFADALTDRARYTKHSTAREAATVARDAGCQWLLLGHISARYPNAEPLAQEAQAVFPNSEVAREGHRYTFDPRDKWDA
jgi:ribonuclease Z